MTLNILHMHSSFDAGGKELRAARLMNAFGRRARHMVVSGVPNALGARAAIAPDIDVAFPDDAPPLAGAVSVARYQALAQFMRRFDLVLSYNWGAIDAVMARRMFAKALPPLVHHEDGFNEDEALELKRERNWLRRLALPAAHALVVPSHTLEDIALRVWKQPPDRVRRIANGVPVADYGAPAQPDAIPGLAKNAGEIVVGSVSGLRAVKDLTRLVSSFAKMHNRARLVIVGEGPERAAILAEAARRGVGDRVLLPGFLPDPHRYMGLFDIFALSSRSEQAPISVIEAMAAGLPVVSPDVGDVRRMVSRANAGYITSRVSELPLHHALDNFAVSPALREKVGAANRAKAETDYDERRMIADYATLYGEAAGRPYALSA